MNFQQKEVKLKDGTLCILRNVEEIDTEDMLRHTKKTVAETHFLTRYPEEVSDSVERQLKMIQEMKEDEGRLLLSAFVDGKIVATIGLNRVSPHIKMRHRATFGLFVEQEYWGMGLGSILIKEVIAVAKQVGYEQMELGVYSDNERARALYSRLGFEEWGAKKNAYRLKDGTYRDEIMMGMLLTT